MPNDFEEKKVETARVKCESCGGNMVFNPETQTLYCPHCGSKKDFVINVTASELDLSFAFSKDREWQADESVVFKCNNCGAKVVLKSGETAKLCPFCGTAHVEKTSELAGLKPNALLPFAFGEEKALALSKAWAKKRFFAPRKFKKYLSADNVNGVYMPCFTFDSYTTSVYDGKIGTRHTRTVGSGKNKHVETYVVWRHIHGTYYDNFDDILVTAGTKFGQKELDRTSPYDTNNGKIFNQNYMLGFSAYRYDREISDCWSDAKGKIDSLIKKRILSKYFYDEIAYFRVSTNHEKVTYKYEMLPVYLGAFNYSKKVYNFYVNGSTGRVYGKTPKSFWKILFTVLGCAGVVVGIVLLIFMLSGT